MKQIADIIQILLTMPGAWGLAGALLCVLIFAQAGKLIWRAWQGSCWLGDKLLLSFSEQTKTGRRLDVSVVTGYFVLALLLFLVRIPVVNSLQSAKQRWLSPTYVSSDTSAYALRCYELEMSRHVSERELAIVRRWSEKTADTLGCSVLDLYQVAYVECGLDPFRVRDDGNAAGWIQFTRTGLDGLGTSLNEVKQMCRDRDAESVMRLTHAYLARFAPLRSATEIYVAVAAAGHAGARDLEHVIYTRSQHPNEYRLNAALWDGWTVEDGKVLRLSKNIDGVISVGDLAGCLEAKKSQLLQRYENRY